MFEVNPRTEASPPLRLWEIPCRPRNPTSDDLGSD